MEKSKIIEKISTKGAEILYVSKDEEKIQFIEKEDGCITFVNFNGSYRDFILVGFCSKGNNRTFSDCHLVSSGGIFLSDNKLKIEICPDIAIFLFELFSEFKTILNFIDLQDIYNYWRFEAEKHNEDEAKLGGSIPLNYIWDCGEQSAREDFSLFAYLGYTISFEDMLKLEENY